VQLADSCLTVLDPELSSHLSSYNLSASIYALPWILTLGSSDPPLTESMAWFDYLFAKVPPSCLLLHKK
jgi:hypothetical protein